MIDLTHAELHFRQPVGHEVGGSVVGRLAKMTRTPPSITAELHRVSLLKGNDLVFFALEDADFDNPTILSGHEYQFALVEAKRWARANSTLTQAA